MSTPENMSWVDEIELEVLDRSTLEAWANCPAQAKLIEAGSCIRETSPLVVGCEAHDVLSRTMRAYMSSPLHFSPYDVREELHDQIRRSRPDVQPDVVENLQYMAYEWSKFLLNIHPDNILHHDGGEGERSGQIAYDLEHLGCRVTSELDFLYTGDSPDVLHEIDYKTGHTTYTVQGIKNSFQFQMHAALVLKKYPKQKALETTIWATRKNQRSYRVIFDREDMPLWTARIEQAAQLAMKFKRQPIERVPTWPEQDKCGLCPVSHLCPRLECHPGDPVAMLEKLIVVENAEAELRKQLIAAVGRTKQDIVTPAGNRFSKVGPVSKGTWKVSSPKLELETEKESE